MPDDGAVATLEAPAADAVVDTTVVDSGSDAGSGSGGTSSNSGDGNGVDNADSPQDGEVDHLRGAELYRAVKEKFRNGEKLTAREIRSMRNAIHIASEADKATGGNLQAFTAERAAFQKLAGDPDSGKTFDQVVEETIAERDFWRGFDDKFEKGDASIVDLMVEKNPESFQQIAPQAMDRFAQVNPEGFSSYVAKSVKGYFDGQQMPLQFAILDTFLPQSSPDPTTQRVIDAIQAIKATVTSLDGMASKPVTPKRADGAPNATGGIDQREQRLTEKESAITRYEWNNEAAPKGRELRDSEINRVASAQKVALTEEDKAKIRTAVKEEVDARLQANSKYGDAMRGYLKAGNKRAYVDRAHSEYQKLIPSVTARHTQAMIDQKKNAPAPKKPVTQQTAGQPPVNRAQNGSNGTGPFVQWISGHPKTINKTVDLNRTTNAMLSRNEAYIKGEKALYKWKSKTL